MVAYRGTQFTIKFAAARRGHCPASEFFDALDIGEQSKLMTLFKKAADHGVFRNPEKFGDLGNGLFEFKSFQIRMPFAYGKDEKRLILVTHGFIKKKNKTPKQEISRAWRILEEDAALAASTKVKR